MTALEDELKSVRMHLTYLDFSRRVQIVMQTSVIVRGMFCGQHKRAYAHT